MGMIEFLKSQEHEFGRTCSVPLGREGSLLFTRDFDGRLSVYIQYGLHDESGTLDHDLLWVVTELAREIAREK